MSAYSTIYISRDAAVRFLLDAIATAPSDDLARMVDFFIEERLLNCTIVGDEDAINNDLLRQSERNTP